MSDARSGDAMSQDSYRTPRTIVVCFDGTASQYDSNNTNVVKFFGLLRKDCPEQQVAYYQAGIGTYFSPGAVSPLWTQLASLLDEAFAWYLDAHVMQGYKYLMDNYRSGDKICIFGFSRGAYTARALAGMLTKVGLLPKDNFQQVSFAYKAYKRGDKAGIKLAAGFKKTFSQDVKVEFIGVWDTVASTGVLVSRDLPFTESNYAVRVFRQALSLDEHRARFRPNLYHRPNQLEESGSDQTTDSDKSTSQKSRTLSSIFGRLLKGKNRLHQVSDEEATPNKTQPSADSELIAEESLSPTDVLEVWFSGCHSDIGGGNVQDNVKVSLAQITLHWMVEQVIESQCGILFDDDELAHIGFTSRSLPPQPSVPATQGLGTLPESETNKLPPVASETEASCAAVQGSPNKPNPVPTPAAYPENSDAIAPLYDQLTLNKLWWILEILPVSTARQDANGVWHTQWTINLGKGRVIPFEKPKFHHTVKQRMDDELLKYKPRAVYNHEVYI